MAFEVVEKPTVFPTYGFVCSGAYRSQARLLTLLRRSHADLSPFGRSATLAIAKAVDFGYRGVGLVASEAIFCAHILYYMSK